MSDAGIDDLIGRWLMNYIRVHAGGITLGTGVYRRVRFRSCGTVGYGPTMWVKGRKGGDVLRDHDSKASSIEKNRRYLVIKGGLAWLLGQEGGSSVM